MNQFGQSRSLKTLAEALLAPPAASAPQPMAQFGQPQVAPTPQMPVPTPPNVQQMQHGRFVDPAARDGDGMADQTPALINGQQPAAMTSGEYVVPADAVSHMGNGSSAAGAQQLDQMVGRVRKMRTGGITQAPQINPRDALPA